MKKPVITIIILLLTLPVLAQKKDFSREEAFQHKNSVALTLAGNGLFLSIDYDRILFVRPKVFMDANMGIGVSPWVSGIIYSHQLIVNVGKKTGFFMVGVGGTFGWFKTDSSGFTETVFHYYLSPIAGWKKIFRSHLFLTVYASPLIPVYASGCYNPVIPFGGASFGFTF